MPARKLPKNRDDSDVLKEGGRADNIYGGPQDYGSGDYRSRDMRAGDFRSGGQNTNYNSTGSNLDL